MHTSRPRLIFLVLTFYKYFLKLIQNIVVRENIARKYFILVSVYYIIFLNISIVLNSLPSKERRRTHSLTMSATDMLTKRPRTPNDLYTNMTDEQIRNIRKVRTQMQAMIIGGTLPPF